MNSIAAEALNQWRTSEDEDEDEKNEEVKFITLSITALCIIACIIFIIFIIVQVSFDNNVSNELIGWTIGTGMAAVAFGGVYQYLTIDE